MSAYRRFEWQGIPLRVLVIALMLHPGLAAGQSVVGKNTNATGPTPAGFYRGIPHYQDNEPHCDRNPLLPSNIICIANGYSGADDAIGDAWPRLSETQDNARTWSTRYLKGSAADPSSDLGLGFGADPITVCFPGGCAGFFIASIRSEGGGTGGGVYMALLPEINSEVGFRHADEAGPPRLVQAGTGDNFLDKIDALFIPDTANPGTISLQIEIETSPGVSELVTREWIKGRFIVVYASINSSNQNVRVFSTFSDDYGLNWSPPKQVANTTGIDTGVAVSAIGDTVFYAYRQFQDDSGGQVDAIWGALSTNRGQTVKNPFVVVDNWCAFDQPTLPNAEDQGVVASRTNNFVDLANDGSNFVMVLAGRFPNPANQSCFESPFDYPAGSRVYVTKSGASGKNWSTPVELAPRDGADGPRNGHSFQFMPAVACVLGTCQAIWYDSIRDSIRNLTYLEGTPARNWISAANAFERFPLFGDFIHQLTEEDGAQHAGKLVQFRRTADVYTRQFTVAGNGIALEDPSPVRVTNFQLAALAPSVVVEVEQLPFSLKQYKSNTVSFMGDYVGLAVDALRGGPDPLNPSAPPEYESNYSVDPANPQLKPSFFAYWTDTRNARGQLYTEEIADETGTPTQLPFEKTPSGGGMARNKVDGFESAVEKRLLEEDKRRSAEGVEDSNAVGDCTPAGIPNVPGATLFQENNRNRIKDADIFGAIIKQPETAWVLNARKGLGGVVEDPNNPGTLIPLQRVYSIVARNEDELAGRIFRFRIMNQPVGFDTNDARASWRQLPFTNFDNQADPPLDEVDEPAGPLSSVTVALFIVSAQAVNPVDVNVYEVDAANNETLVASLTVDGTLLTGDLVTPAGAPFNVNEQEIHDPIVYEPTATSWDPETWAPDVWNPDVWNPDVWNPDVWNPDVWNPDVWNPDVWNPDVWNPDVWNPDVWNVSLTDASTLDNPEIPSPDVSGIQATNNEYAKFDVQFTAVNDGNTTTPYVADFAANSTIVRQALANGDATVQIIVWQDFDLESYQGCDPDLIVDPSNPTAFEPTTAGQNRILAVADGADMLTLKIPTINDNRFGSVTYSAEPLDDVHFTLRFIAAVEAIPSLAPELAAPGSISYVVTSQAANTGDLELNLGEEQVIFDGIPPTLTVNSPLPVVLDAIRIGADVGVNLPANLVTASRDGEPDPDVICAPYDLGTFAAIGLGTTSFTCSATSSQNNATGIIEFDVVAVDNDAPTLGPLPPNQTVERDAFDSATFSYTLPTATDAIDDDVEVVCVPVGPNGPAPFSAPGPTQTQIDCTASDDADPPNTTTGSFFVTVEDTTAPVVTVPGPPATEATSPQGAQVFFPAPTATDVGSVTLSCTAGSGDLFPIGVTTVDCTATDDANNSATESFLVTVVDTTAPVIAAVADISVEANTTGGANNVGFTEPAATDLGNPIGVSCDKDPAGAFYPLGDTLVTCTTDPDAGGQTSSTSFTVTVVDTTPPVLTVPADIVSIIGPVTFAATAVDIADPAPVVNCMPPSGSTFPLGTTTVDCTATDASGNSAADSFTVTTELGTGDGLNSNKKAVKAGSVAAFTWEWTNASGAPYDVGDGNQDVEARPCLDANCQTLGDDMLDEDPGSSDIRRTAGSGWQFNWQTVDEFGDPIAPGDYVFIVTLLTNGQQQTATIKVTP